MTNYFIVYITGNNKTTKHNHIKKQEDVINLLVDAKQAGSIRYLIIKRTKQGTDVPLLRGDFKNDFDIKKIQEEIDVDFRIVKNELGGIRLVRVKASKEKSGIENER